MNASEFPHGFSTLDGWIPAGRCWRCGIPFHTHTGFVLGGGDAPSNVALCELCASFDDKFEIQWPLKPMDWTNCKPASVPKVLWYTHQFIRLNLRRLGCTFSSEGMDVSSFEVIQFLDNAAKRHGPERVRAAIHAMWFVRLRESEGRFEALTIQYLMGERNIIPAVIACADKLAKSTKMMKNIDALARGRRNLEKRREAKEQVSKSTRSGKSKQVQGSVTPVVVRSMADYRSQRKKKIRTRLEAKMMQAAKHVLVPELAKLAADLEKTVDDRVDARIQVISGLRNDRAERTSSNDDPAAVRHLAEGVDWNEDGALLTVRLPPNLVERLVDTCEQEDLYVGSVIQGAIGQFLSFGGGALDKESASINARFSKTMERKRNGETKVPWGVTGAPLYNMAASLWAHLGDKVKVYIDQELPDREQKDIIEVYRLPTYEDLVAHVKDRFWDGQKRKFRWTLYKNGHQQIASDVICLGATVTPPFAPTAQPFCQQPTEERLPDSEPGDEGKK